MVRSIAIAVLLAAGFFSTSSVYAQAKEPWKAPAEAEKLKNPNPVTAETIANGQATYEMLCAMCHGETGLGDGPAGSGSEISPANFTHATVQAQSDGAIFWKMSKGRLPMAAYEKALSEQERWELVAYIRELGKATK